MNIVLWEELNYIKIMNWLNNFFDFINNFGKCKCGGNIKVYYFNPELDCNIYQCNKCKIEYK